MSVAEEELGVDVIEDDYDSSAHQGCYIFRAPATEPEAIDNRAKKRRKVSKSQHVHKEIPSYPRLLGGLESESSAKLRQSSFERLWAARQDEIDKIIAEPNNSFLGEIARFVRHPPKSESGAKLPTGLVVVGKDGGTQQRLLHQWQSDDRTKPSEYLIQLDHNQAANITSALKSIIRSVIASSLGQEGYIEFLSKHKRLIPMNYDLELLQRFVEEEKVERVVISVLDVEGFDISVLSDMTTMLASWTDRIPFVLLVGISTTVELFEARLPKSVIHHLIPREFDLPGLAFNPMYKIFMVTQQGSTSDGMLWLGPAAANALLERSKEQETTPEMFGRMIKYAYMSHFFANSLSILAAPDQELDEQTEALACEAARNTPSFMEYMETTLNIVGSENTKAQEIASLLNNDRHLMTSIRAHVAEGRAKMEKHYTAVTCLKEVIISLRNAAAVQGQELPGYDVSAPSAVSDDIFDSSVLALAGPDAVEIMLENLHFHETLEKMSAEMFSDFLSAESSTTFLPLLESPTLKTLQQRMKALPTLNSSSLSTLFTAFTTAFTTALQNHLTDPTTLSFHEIFTYNGKTPLSLAFTPTPRYAIERALQAPADYLACQCCGGGEDGATNPPTAILWKLWCEAGSVVNARDLWQAFRGVLIPRERDEDEEDSGEVENGGSERKVLALFYRSLAELQMLGMLKMSKRKPGVECLAKIVWRGM
jgi:origin recognition complex subunit 3